MRIFIGGIETEIDSFTPVKHVEEDFNAFYWTSEKFDDPKYQSSELAGYNTVLRNRHDVEIIGGYVSSALSLGNLTTQAFDSMSNKLFESIRKSGKLDGVLLRLHGAMVADGCFDCEGYLLKKIREIVGPSVKIVCSLDYHGSMTKMMMGLTDAVCSLRTYPHIDYVEIGVRAATILLKMLDNNINVTKLYGRIPFIMPVENSSTEHGPITEIFEMFYDMLKHENVLEASLFLTQPWLDVPELGCTLAVYAKCEDDGSIRTLMTAILKRLWKKRAEFTLIIPPLSSVLDEIDNLDKPISIVDLGDIVTGGAIGDSTVAIRELLGRKRNYTSWVIVYDPESVTQAFKVGSGNEDLFKVGGKFDYGYNQKIAISAKVIQTGTQSLFLLGKCKQGSELDIGRRALLCIDCNIYIVVTEKRCAGYDKVLPLSFGIDPNSIDVYFQKTHQMFKAGYEDVHKTIRYSDTPGFSDRALSGLPYKNVNRPIYPLDDFEDFIQYC